MTDSHPEDGVLTPDELASESDDLAELGENRFLVRTGERVERPTLPRTPPHSTPLASSAESGDHPDAARADPEPDDSRLATDSHPHGIALSLKLDGCVSSHYASSTDVREVFVGLLRWYATQLDGEMPPEETLRVMLESSDLDV
jgi:hypothetical protein